MYKNIHLITSLKYGGTERFLSTLTSNDTNHDNVVICLKKNSYNDVIFNKKVELIYLNFSSNLLLNFFEFVSLIKILKNYKIKSLNLWLYHTFLIGSIISIFLNSIFSNNSWLPIK